MEFKTSLQFINHASLMVRHGPVSLLSDPWYQGDAFHKGWSLVHEFKDDEILFLLGSVTHIWISHEHPDHFSISFFKKFREVLKERNIQILFQRTSDKRVERYLSASGFNMQILEFNSWVELSKDFQILCFKDGFYDSGLVIKTSDKKILNLNDCEIKDSKRCREVLKITGECDILASQFSYAAWKGGVDNVDWRRLAAKEKIDTMKLQASYFKPKIIVPFASYVYFSNDANFYLNDSVNKPSDIIAAFVQSDVQVKVMKPFEILDHLDAPVDNKDSVVFWEEAFDSLDLTSLNHFEVVAFDSLNHSFDKYKERVFQNNAKWFVRLVRLLSPISVFKPVTIKIKDLDLVVKLDLFSNALERCGGDADLSMSSESLNFILTNTFGFDTLTVNGCFEEESTSGFSRATRTLAIENLNNLGIEFRPSIVFNITLISIFFSRLLSVSKKLQLGKNS